MGIACFDPYTGELRCVQVDPLLFAHATEDGCRACCASYGLLYSYGARQFTPTVPCDDPIHTEAVGYLFGDAGYDFWYPYIGNGVTWQLSCTGTTSSGTVETRRTYACLSKPPWPELIRDWEEYVRGLCSGLSSSTSEIKSLTTLCGVKHYCCRDDRCTLQVPSECKRLGGHTYDGAFYTRQSANPTDRCTQCPEQGCCSYRPCCRKHFWLPETQFPGYPPWFVPYSGCDMRLPSNCISPPGTPEPDWWYVPDDLPFAWSCYHPHACADDDFPIVCIWVRFAHALRPPEHEASDKGFTPGYMEIVSEKREMMVHDELGPPPVGCKLQYGDLVIARMLPPPEAPLEAYDYVMGAVCLNDTPWNEGYLGMEHVNYCPWTIEDDGYAWMRCGYRFWRRAA